MATAAALFGAIGPLYPGEARADATAAEALFRQAKSLMAQERYAEACPMLAESQRLDPSGGTMLHLANCHKQEGRIATAYKELLDAILFAQRDKRPDREKAAKALAAELSPKLPKLTIKVSEEAARLPGLEIKRDGELVPASAYGIPAAVDPGEHAVTAWAPGMKRFSTTAGLRGEGVAETVVVPALEVDPRAPRSGHDGDTAGPFASAGADKTKGSFSAPQKVGVAVGAAGIAAIGVGAVFGLQAMTAKDDSDSHCKGNICDAEGVRLRAEGITAADISTGAFIAGGALAVGGLILVVAFKPSSPAAPARDTRERAASVTSLALGPAWASVQGQF